MDPLTFAALIVKIGYEGASFLARLKAEGRSITIVELDALDKLIAKPAEEFLGPRRADA